jgi:hypothetical protein
VSPGVGGTGGMNRSGDSSGYGSPGTTATGGGMGTGTGSTPNSATMNRSNTNNMPNQMPNQMAPNGTMQNGQ